MEKISNEESKMIQNSFEKFSKSIDTKDEASLRLETQFNKKVVSINEKLENL